MKLSLAKELKTSTKEPKQKQHTQHKKATRETK